jgi:GH35 family endo-1,4-beta-xylanase
MANLNRAHIEGYLAWIQYLKDQRGPVDVVGLLCYFAQFLRSPDECLAIPDHFAAFGCPLHVTELDINTPDELVQADYMRDIMTVLYSHSAVEKITLWGFWEGCHWLPLAAMWRKDWSIKPKGQVWLDLVFKQWRTNARLKTDGRGTASLRVFLGDYEVTTTCNGKVMAQNHFARVVNKG